MASIIENETNDDNDNDDDDDASVIDEEEVCAEDIVGERHIDSAQAVQHMASKRCRYEVAQREAVKRRRLALAAEQQQRASGVSVAILLNEEAHQAQTRQRGKRKQSELKGTRVTKISSPAFICGNVAAVEPVSEAQRDSRAATASARRVAVPQQRTASLQCLFGRGAPLSEAMPLSNVPAAARPASSRVNGTASALGALPPTRRLDRSNVQPLPVPSAALRPNSSSSASSASTSTSTRTAISTRNVRRSNALRLSDGATARLERWLDCHLRHPYPTKQEKSALATQCGITAKQVQNYLINTRRRHMHYVSANAIFEWTSDALRKRSKRTELK